MSTENENQVVKTPQELQEIYLDWVNNWISVEAFAHYYELSESKARELIEQGRRAHEWLKEQ